MAATFTVEGALLFDLVFNLTVLLQLSYLEDLAAALDMVEHVFLHDDQEACVLVPFDPHSACRG